jgi:hypothetical protein
MKEIQQGGVLGRIAVLERRANHLRQKLEGAAYARTTSGDFDRAEVDALEMAIAAMRRHSASLKPDTDPVGALEQLVTAVEEDDDDKIGLALERAADALRATT